MSISLTPESIPLLAPRTSIFNADDQFVVETDETTYTFAGSAASVLAAAVPLLNGSISIGQIAERIGVDELQLTAVLSTFDDDRLILDVGQFDVATSAVGTVDALRSECGFWSKEIFLKPFWRTVMDGRAFRPLVLGWGIEFYHFVESANEYMAAGAANCREDSTVRELLVKHYVEEANHGEIFLSGLEGCGLKREDVIASPPLASTRALINYLYELAIDNSFSYASAFAVMQPSKRAENPEAVRSFYSRLSDLYPFATPMFTSFQKHALIDVELEHNEIALDKMARSHSSRLMDHKKEMIVAARGLVEQFMLFFEGIYEFYSRPRTILPRRAFQLPRTV